MRLCDNSTSSSLLIVEGGNQTHKINLISMAILDTVSTVGGLAATGITLAAVASVPMLPIIATGALVTGLGCAAYSVGRSTFKLVRFCRIDRRHEKFEIIFRIRWTDRNMNKR